MAGAERAKLRLKIRPRRAIEDRRRCFKATVKTQNGSRVQGAKVRIGKRARRTNERGRTRICRRFAKPGAYKATAKKVGFTKARKRIRVRRGRR